MKTSFTSHTIELYSSYFILIMTLWAAPTKFHFKWQWRKLRICNWKMQLKHL